MEVMDTLTPREKKVLELRFGILDGRTRTLEEVGKEVQRHPRAHPPDRGQGPAQAAPPQPQQETAGLPELTCGKQFFAEFFSA
jgi:hypothetical protein